MNEGRTRAPGRRLSAEELAQETHTSTDYVALLVESGAIRPDAGGFHQPADVVSVRLARALADGGVDVDGLVWAMRTGILPLDRLAEMWDTTGPSGRTFADLAASVGDRAADLPAIYAAFGLAAPPPETVLRQDEEDVLTRFLELWGLLDGERDVYLRAARIAGEGVRRIELSTLDLFDELGGSPPQRLRRGISEDEAMLPSNLLGGLLPPLFRWLHARHLEHEVFERIVGFVEASLDPSAPMDAQSREPTAVAFVDLASFTALTQAVGDEQAARSLLTFHALAEDAVRGHRGRVVKLLGDGVMLRYDSVAEAVASVRQLMAAISKAGLPGAHAGIAAGPVVARDGDIFGHTVNLAERIASHATTGELLVTVEVAERLAADGIRWALAGVAHLKGIDGGIELARILGE